MIIPAGITAAKPSGGGGGYTGPLDIVPGAAWLWAYGQRALSAAARGQPVYTIGRVEDNETLVVNSDPVTGEVAAATVSSFVGSGLSISSVEVADVGSGYSDGTFDLTLVGGSGSAAVINVTVVDGTGHIAFFNSITNWGDYSEVPESPISVTGGDGTGATFNCEFAVRATLERWNDQSGNATDVTLYEPYPNTRALWRADGGGGRPGLWNLSDGRLSAGYYIGAQPVNVASGATTYFLVCQEFFESDNENEDQSAYNYIRNTSGGTITIDIYNGTNEAGGEFDGSFLAGRRILIAATYNFGTAKVWVNEVPIDETSSYDSGGPLGPILGIKPKFIVGSAVTAGLQEYIAADGLFTDEQILAVSQNIGAFYGITFPELVDVTTSSANPVLTSSANHVQVLTGV